MKFTLGVSSIAITMWCAAALSAQTPPAGAPPASAARASSSASRPVAAAAAGPKLRVRSITLRIGNRAFPDFSDQVTTRLKQEFSIGDTKYSGKVVEFVPDFVMGMQSRKVVTRSNEPRNPAARIIVRNAGVPQDTTWAFMDMPPHFARRSLIAFKLVRVEFENHAPISEARDTAQAVKPAGRP